MRRFLGFAALLAALSPGVTLADDDWTEILPEDVSRYSLHEISFEGDSSIPEGELRDQIRSSTSGIFRFRPVDLDRIEGDVHRLRSHFRRAGFWEVEVSRRILFLERERHTHAIFEIDEGVQRIVGDVRVLGNQTFSAQEILGWTELRTGDAFDLTQTDIDRTEIENNYANRGFYLVEIVADVPKIETITDPFVYDLVYRVTEGARFLVGRIQIEGNRHTADEIIRRELVLDEGDILSRGQLLESRTRLFATGFFSGVEILPQPRAAGEARLDLLVKVRERQTRFVGVGLGYGTRDQLRVTGEWGHRNLWGRGKRLTVRATIASELFPVDLIRNRLEVRFVEPRFFGTRTTTSSDFFIEQRREFFPDSLTGQRENYDLNLVAVIVNANRRFTRSTRGWLSLENEWADVDAAPDLNPPDDLRPDITRTLTLTLERDRRDHLFEPQRGFVNRVRGRVSGGLLGGDNNFWKTSVESSWYRNEGPLVLAGRVRVGYEQPFGDSEVVVDRERFKIGGAASVRGYREQEIGPGDFLILGNFEVRFPVYKVVWAGVFLDVGNAWENFSDVRLEDFDLINAKSDPSRASENDVRYATGAGLRVKTPVGPVRLDYGRKLKILPVVEGESEEDRWRIHLSLGHQF